MGKAVENHNSKHMPSGRWRLGFVLAVVTVLLWSTVPIALSLLLDRMDAITITWYRFFNVASSMDIMLMLYAFGVVVMLPFCSLAQIRELSTGQYVVLAYSSVNMLIGYGCFAEALQHWEASRVSTVVCTTPLLTLAMSHPAHAIWPDRIMPDVVNAVGWIGAMLVVAGSMLAALGGRQRSVLTPISVGRQR